MFGGDIIPCYFSYMLRNPIISLHLNAKIYFATQSSKALFMEYARLSLISIKYYARMTEIAKYTRI